MKKENFKEIEFFLYNYEKLDYMIKLIEEDYIDAASLGLSSYLKGLTCKTKTMENQIIKMAGDARIKKYKKWQVFLKKALAYFSSERFIEYSYIVLKYFDGHTDEEIENTLKLDRSKQKKIKMDIINYIYVNAILDKLL